MRNIENTCLETIKVNGSEFKIYNPRALSKAGYDFDNVPFSIIILAEQILRNQDGKKFLASDIEKIGNWNPKKKSDDEIPFMPARVVLQDFTGVPSLVDLATLRSELAERNLDPELINPQVPVDLIIDHSVQVDQFATKLALHENSRIEFKRNFERYKFLKWGQSSFKNLTVFPPGAGIIHQINLEYLSKLTNLRDGFCLPDSLVGTDSHTTMINGLGVVGWGVGGIEAESAMLNQPIFMKLPEVVGFNLSGSPKPGVTATDIVLRVTEILRAEGVVEKFVEFYGTGLDSISVVDRATIANMSPEYGATMGYFPVDADTIHYLRKTGRNEEDIVRSEAYFKALGIFRDKNTKEPSFSSTISLDLSTVVPSIAGPKRPQDRIDLTSAQKNWHQVLAAPIKQRGFEVKAENANIQASVEGKDFKLSHGSIVIAAITSCTNTSNPGLLLTAGLLAKKAYEKGLRSKPWVKTSFAPGSRVVTDYMEISKLQPYLEHLGFNIVGYGCTTCIGNSGPLNPEISKAIKDNNLVACSILSGNRNFEGRIHVDIKANYLASPPLVVAYALAGTMDIDLTKDPIAEGTDGPVYLKDIWPSLAETRQLEELIIPKLYTDRYSSIMGISKEWNELDSAPSKVYDWDKDSTYIQKPSFFDGLKLAGREVKDITGARALLKLGDSVTTDHISPAGGFSDVTAAGKFLSESGLKPVDYNTYGSRRGNDQVMVRGTFANVRIRNQIVPGVEGGFTKLLPDGEVMSVYDASIHYKSRNTPLIVIAGAEYGSGSSRDWAAKGPYLLGVKAVIAVSFERIHRSNLIGMGILPLQFLPGESAESLKLTGLEQFSILGLSQGLKPQQKLTLQADDRIIPVLSRLDTAIEVEYFKNGGILHTVLIDIINKAKAG